MADTITWKDRGVSPEDQLARLASEHPTVEKQIEVLHAEYAELLARPAAIQAEIAALSAELGPIENRRRVVSDLIQHLQHLQHLQLQGRTA